MSFFVLKSVWAERFGRFCPLPASPKKGTVVAIEVKGNAEKSTGGLAVFREKFKPKTAFIVGDGGISAAEFLTMDIRKLF